MPSLSGLHMCAHDIERAFVALVQRDQFFVGQPFLGELPQRFQTQLQCLLGNHCCASLVATLRRFASRTLSVSAGRNSRMSSTMPTSATWKIGALGFLLMATMNGIALQSGQVLERAADAAGQVDLGLHGLAGRAHLARLLQPLGIDHRTRATHRRAHAPRPDLARWRRCPAPGCRGRWRPAPLSLVISTSPASATTGLQITAALPSERRLRRTCRRSCPRSAAPSIGLNAPGRTFSTAPVEMSQRTCALTWPPNSWRTTLSELPSTPSISSTSGTNAAFSLMDSPGERSMPK